MADLFEYVFTCFENILSNADKVLDTYHLCSKYMFMKLTPSRWQFDDYQRQLSSDQWVQLMRATSCELSEIMTRIDALGPLGCIQLGKLSLDKLQRLLIKRGFPDSETLFSGESGLTDQYCEGDLIVYDVTSDVTDVRYIQVKSTVQELSHSHDGVSVLQGIMTKALNQLQGLTARGYEWSRSEKDGGFSLPESPPPIEGLQREIVLYLLQDRTEPFCLQFSLIDCCAEVDFPLTVTVRYHEPLEDGTNGCRVEFEDGAFQSFHQF